MRILFDDRLGKKRIILSPGELVVSKEDEILYTLLGSCVSVCLWDNENNIAGMNHFLLARRTHTVDTVGQVDGRYGDEATQLLIDRLITAGADQTRLRAKIFGAASMLGCCQHISISEANAALAVEYLMHQHIPIVASHLGGTKARRLYLEVFSGRVRMEQVDRQNYQKETGSCVNNAAGQNWPPPFKPACALD